MEEGKQYSGYSVESNPRAYMTMRDYRNLAWQNQQPLGRNPNPPRSMREYRDQWMNTPSCSFPPTYAPPPPQYAFSPQPEPQQLISPIEQAILNLSKIVDNFKEEQKALSVQGNQETDIVENSLDLNLNGLQSEIGQKLDSLQGGIDMQCPISKLAQHHGHQKEGNQEEQFLFGTTVEEQCEDQDAATSPLLTEESSGQEKGEEPQKFIPQPNPMNLDHSATAQPEHSPLPAPSTDQNQVHVLPAEQPKTPEAPAPKPKSTPSLPAMQKFKRLVASVRNIATTSKTMAAAHMAWHCGWFGCRFGFGAPEPRHS